MSLPQLPFHSFTTQLDHSHSHRYKRAKDRVASQPTHTSTRTTTTTTTTTSQGRGRTTAQRRDRPEDILIRDDDSELDSALSSPWTTLTSPSESEFENIQDPNLITPLFNPTDSAPSSPPPRSFSHSRTYHHGYIARRKPGEATPDYAMRPRTKREESGLGEMSEGGREGDGDDEYSGVEGSRGRGRTRERRKKEEEGGASTGLGMGSRNMLEEALRSSLATLLTLSSNPPTLSPAISYSSLSSLLSPSHRSPGTFSPPHPHARPDFRQPPTFHLTLSQSIALSSPSSPLLSRSPSTTSEEVEEEDVSSSEGTELAPRPSSFPRRASTIASPTTTRGGLVRGERRSSPPRMNLTRDEDDQVGGTSEIKELKNGGPVGATEGRDEGNSSWKWWKRTVQVKVWHLVGLAGLLVVGLGVGASGLLKELVSNRTKQRISLF